MYVYQVGLLSNSGVGERLATQPMHHGLAPKLTASRLHVVTGQILPMIKP